jgi:hypothetical protein
MRGANVRRGRGSVVLRNLGSNHLLIMWLSRARDGYGRCVCWPCLYGGWKRWLAMKLCAAQPRSDKQCGARLRRIGPRVAKSRRGWRVPAAVYGEEGNRP